MAELFEDHSDDASHYSKDPAAVFRDAEMDWRLDPTEGTFQMMDSNVNTSRVDMPEARPVQASDTWGRTQQVSRQLSSLLPQLSSSSQLSRDVKAEVVALKGLIRVGRQSRSSEKLGRGMDCNQFTAMRRQRGLDFLYNCSTSVTKSSHDIQSERQQMARRSSTGLRKADIQYMAEVLRKTPAFVNMEVEAPGLIDGLTRSGAVSLLRERQGQVLFRQDDAPSSFYAVSVGTVGVYIKEVQTASTPRSMDDNDDPTFTLTEAVDGNMRPPGLFKKIKGAPPPPRYKTSEGHSFFSDISKFGKKVAELGPGKVFGEQGLLQNAPRNATIKCITDVEFLILDPTRYFKIRADLTKRAEFFATHLPGFSTENVEDGRHPSVGFELMTYQKGDIILRQGVGGVLPSIYLLRDGQAEVRRFAVPGANPTYVLAMRPLEAASLTSGCRLPRPGIAGVPENAVEEYPFPRQGMEEVTIDRLLPGDSCAPLTALNLRGEEPFSVMISSEECNAYKISGAPFHHLSPKLMKELRSYLMQALNRRLAMMQELPQFTGSLITGDNTTLPSLIP
mmetsp:Transcript_64126/g.134825  ORF Transcript_64126/g.134825 Transcript_64126/m.134825 type:complete len:562 (-) Transcript_64126:97-1782(-)